MGLARQASRIPLTALSLGLEAWERSAGLRAFALRRGGEALQIAAHTPLGRLLPKFDLDDGADEESARITAAVRADVPAPSPSPPSRPAPSPPSRPAPSPSSRPAPSPSPAPPSSPSPQVSDAAKEVGAPGAATAAVELIVEQLEVAEPDRRDELPIPDFDNISLGALRARLRSLNVEQLVVLREWEQAHAHRLPVLTALDNRIAKLGAASAYPQESAGNASTHGSPRRT